MGVRHLSEGRGGVGRGETAEISTSPFDLTVKLKSGMELWIIVTGLESK